MCGHPLEPGMKICDKCGSIQRGSRARGERATTTSMPRAVPCKFCGESTTNEEKVCNACVALQERIASGYYSPEIPESPPGPAGFIATLRAIWAAVLRFLRRLFSRKR